MAGYRVHKLILIFIQYRDGNGRKGDFTHKLYAQRYSTLCGFMDGLLKKEHVRDWFAVKCEDLAHAYATCVPSFFGSRSFSLSWFRPDDLQPDDIEEEDMAEMFMRGAD